MRISQSGLKKWNDCPGKCFLRYGEGLEEDSNHFAEVGKMVHAMIEEKLNGVVHNQREMFSIETMAVPEAIELFQRWEKKFYPDLNPQDVLSIEGTETIQLGKNELEVRFDDVRDIGGFLTITDHKTTHKILTQEELRADVQTRVQCVVAHRLFPEYDQIVFRHCNIRFGEYQVLELEASEVKDWESSLEDFIALVAARFEARKAGNKDAMPFTPGKACINCGFFDRCPAVKKALKIDVKALSEPKTIIRQDQAEAVGAKLIILGRFYDQLRQSLKLWVDQKGPVKIEGMTWAIRPTTTNWIDVERIPEELFEKLREYMVLDDSKKSRIWENTQLVQELQAVGAIKVKLSSRFDVKEDEEPEN